MPMLMLGFKTPKIIGINDKGKPEVFNPGDDFKSPSKEQIPACQSYALKYYQNAEDTLGDFALVEITDKLLKTLANNPSKALLEINIFQGKAKIKLRRCRFCGSIFAQTTPWQEVCLDKKCRRQRIRENLMDYYYRKKGKK